MVPSVVIITIQYLAIAILLYELIYAICQQPSEMQKYVIVLTISTMLMFIGYIIELQAENLSESLAGTAISYMGKPFVMVSSFLFICSFYGKQIKPSIVEGLYLFGFIFPVIVFTNKYHYLYYKTVEYDVNQVYSPLVLTHGPFYYLYVASSVLFFVSCLIVIIQGHKKSRNKTRNKLFIYSILMVASGILGYAVFLVFDTKGYDSTMLGVLGSVICLFLIFIQCNVFDPLAQAKDFALEDSLVGLIVFNEIGKLVYKNDSAEKMLKSIPMTIVSGMTQPDLMYRAGGRTYQLTRRDLKVDGNKLGTSIEIVDNTDITNYQTKLEENIRERTSHIERIQRRVISSLANIVEARMIENRGITTNTGTYAYLIAKKLRLMGVYEDELTDEFVTSMVDTAPLHDIGRISVPDSILLKPTALTPEEFETMKYHTIAGPNVIETTMRGLEANQYISMAKNISHYHHEWWDGTGYPEGLKGEHIPLAARIIAVADAYEALTTERSYNVPVSSNEALRIIQSEAGTHFDPKIVTAFALVVADHN